MFISLSAVHSVHSLVQWGMSESTEENIEVDIPGDDADSMLRGQRSTEKHITLFHGVQVW